MTSLVGNASREPRSAPTVVASFVVCLSDSMPITGLPVAVEAVLSSLLPTHVLSSWKVAGENDTTVAVLRFKQDGEQAGTSTEHSRGHWRRKPPSQMRRDQQRAQERKQNGEKNAMNTFSPEYEDSVAANNNVFSCANVSSRAPLPCSARETRSMTTDCQPAQVTFDLPCSQVDISPRDTTQTVETVDSNADHNTVDSSLSHDQGDTCTAIQSETTRSENSEVTLEDVQTALASLHDNLCQDLCRALDGAFTAGRDDVGADVASEVQRKNHAEVGSASSSSILGVCSSRESSNDRRGQNEADNERNVSTLCSPSRHSAEGKMKEDKSPRRPLRDKRLSRRYQPQRAVRK